MYVFRLNILWKADTGLSGETNDIHLCVPLLVQKRILNALSRIGPSKHFPEWILCLLWLYANVNPDKIPIDPVFYGRR